MVSPSAQPPDFLGISVNTTKDYKDMRKAQKGAARMVDYIVLLRARVKLYRERLEEEEQFCNY